MKASVVLLVLTTALTVTANSIHDASALAARHAHLARRDSFLKPRAKRCRDRPAKNTNNLSAPAPSPPAGGSPPENQNQDNDNSSGGDGGGGGVIHVNSNCGPSGATEKTTATTGPNGSLDWLNCGIDNGGWNPPYLQISDLKMKSLSAAVESGNSPFNACRDFIHLFEKYGGEFGIPPIMLASFAMQESSCRPDTVGGGGEQGLMQITHEKCGGAPGGNCRDPDFNIRTGSKFFADLLKSNGGDVLISLARYNGWYKGITIAKATAAAHSDCCRCQNNLDYLHQFVNGWCQNIDAYNQSNRLGKYFNLDVC